MRYFEVKVGDLKSFVNSAEFHRMNEIPISTVRAISQALNPNADLGDIALIYALNEQDQLVGYIGILPSIMYTPVPEKIFFNSCWWVHPKLGRDVGMKLFYRMLQITHGKIVFFELSRHTESILRHINGMSFSQEIIGFQGFTRINLSGWIPIRFKFLSFLRPLTRFTDWLFNLPVRLYYHAFHSYKANASKFIFEKIDIPDGELWSWVNQLEKPGIKFRATQEFQWIKQNPWIISLDKDINGESNRYKFSVAAKDWKQDWLKVVSDGNPIGLFFLSKRDGLLRVPYAWFSSGNNKIIGQAFQQFLVEEKASSMICFNPALVNAMNSAGGFFLFRRQRHKVMAWPEAMNTFMQKGYAIQDGDGDAVFT